MYQANQDVVNQNANISLVDIRQSEIDYFATFFTSFGTQCFFLTGILAGSVSQAPSFHCAQRCSYTWQYLYNISVAICMATCVINVMISVFVSVYAQGLAIRGKSGSMINAIQGMIAEQEKVVQIFIFSVIIFQLQTFALFFIVAERYWAVGCGCIVAAIGYYTYIAALRIYNRFKWDFEKSGWNYDEKMDDNKALSELNPKLIDELLRESESADISSSHIKRIYTKSVEKGLISKEDTAEKKKQYLLGVLQRKKKQQPIAPQYQSESSDIDDNESESNAESVSEAEEQGQEQRQQSKSKNNIPFQSQEKKSKSVFKKLTSPLKRFAGNKKAPSVDIPENNSQADNDSQSDSPYLEMNYVPSSNVKHSAEGYLRVKISTPATLSMFNKSQMVWKNYYFILQGASMFYYANENAFRKNPSKPINARPIDLEGYAIKSGSPTPPFAFQLQPVEVDDIRKTWHFETENANTFKYWTDKIGNMIDRINRKMSK